MSIPERVATILGLALMFCTAYLVEMEWTNSVWTIFGLFCGATGLSLASGVRLSIARRK